MTSQIPIARKNCANWSNGKCLGCMFKRENDKLYIHVDKDFAGKPCVVDEGCHYFEEIVLKGKICT